MTFRVRLGLQSRRAIQLSSVAVVLLFCSFFTGNSYAIDAREYAIEASVDVLTSPSALRFTWRPSEVARAYYIRRRPPGSADWGSPRASLPASATEYIDSDIAVGTAYEYEIQMESTIPASSGGWMNAYGYVLAGANVSLMDARGKVLVLVDGNVASLLAAEIDSFQKDLIGAGWIPIRRDLPKVVSVVDVKNLVRAEYNADPSNLKAVILLGHVPVPYAGNIAPDLHESHRGAWPADVYYADIDGTWTDSTVNIVSTDSEDNDNRPGDGKFDQSQIPSAVELEIGRIDFRDLPAFGTRTQVDLLRTYLRKNREFRHRLFTAERRGLIRDNFGDLDGDAPAVDAWRHFPQFFGRAAIREVGPGAFFPTLQNESFLWAYACGGGGYVKADGVGSTADFATQDPRAVFLMLHGSYFGDWNNTDNFLRAAIATPNFTLASVWSGLPHWYMHPMALGKTIGHSTRLTQNNLNEYKSHQNISAQQVHISLIGDPTLEMFPVIPPANLSGSAGGTVNLSWAASTDENVVGYHVYHSASVNGPFQRITTAPVSGSTYAHAIGTGTHHYMVRAIKLERTGSGTFYNASQGVFTSVTKTSDGEVPVVSVEVKDGEGSESGPDAASVRILRSAVNENALTVEYLIGGTAQNGIDYALIGTSVVIPAGESSVTLSITPLADQQVEGDETITLQIRPNAAYTVGSSPFGFLKIKDAVNQPPVISQIADRTFVSGSHTGDLAFQVSDAESAADALQVRAHSSDEGIIPSSGITFTGSGANRTVRIAAAGQASGTVTITLSVSDGVNEASSTFRVTVTPPNLLPTASPQAIGTLENTPVEILLAGHDPEGYPLSFIMKVQPSNGSLSGNAPNLTYIPRTNFYGADAFSFSVSDGNNESAPAQVSINVVRRNKAPMALPASVQTGEDMPLSITLAGFDRENDPLQFEIGVQPTKGTLQGTGSSYIYTPNVNVFGPDAFTFRVRDGEFSSEPAGVAINIIASNDPPRGVTQHFSIFEDETVNFTLGGNDPDNDTLVFQLVSSPAHGTISGTPPSLSFRPATNFNGMDALSYVVTDGMATSAVATVSFVITSANDSPIALEQVVEGDEDSPTPIRLAGSDPDGDTLLFRIVNPPQHGQLTGEGTNLVYTPSPDFSGADAFTYVANDGDMESEPATVSIVVRAINDPPWIGAVPPQQTQKNFAVHPVTLSLGDVDRPIGELLLWAQSSNPALISTNGISFTADGSGRKMILMPTANVSGSALITLGVSDGQAVAQTSFTLTVVNNAPVATSDILIEMSGLVTIPAQQLLANDSDADRDSLKVISVSQSRLGRSVVVTNDTIIYMGDGEALEDSFSYTIEDTSLETATATVWLTLHRGSQIQSIQASGGSVALRFTGPPSAAFNVESSSDMKTWLEAATGRTDANGRAEVNESGGGNRHRFYRIKWP